MSQPIVLDGGAKEIRITLPPDFTVSDGKIIVKADFTNIVVAGENRTEEFELGDTQWQITIDVKTPEPS